MIRIQMLLALVLACGALTAPRAEALAFYSTADTSFHTTAPSLGGIPSDGGWQWVGNWIGFQAVPIDAHHFLAANHIGGSVGNTFILNGATYTTVNTFGDASTDLRIWEVRETFPSWAPLYTNGNEIGKGLVVFGRGVIRGAAVNTAVAVPGVPAGALAGWQWAASDGQLRWGQNTVVNTITPTGSLAGFGQQLYAVFNPLDKNAGNNVCHLGVGDSSGPVFIQDGTTWKLAGVAGLVDAYFNTTNSGNGFNAFIFDCRGLYYGSSGSWSLQSGSTPIPSGFYATRVSVRAAWIAQILTGPLTAAVTLSDLSQTYDGTPKAVAVATNPAGLTASVTYNGSSTPPTGAGSFAVVATVTTAGYTGSASGTLTVAQATQSISFPALSDMTAGAGDATLTATATSGLPVSYASSNLTIATVSGATLHAVAAGTATITASQDGNSNYLAAQSVSEDLTVLPPNSGGGTGGSGSDIDGTPLFSAPELALLLTLLAATGLAFVRRPSHCRPRP